MEIGDDADILFDNCHELDLVITDVKSLAGEAQDGEDHTICSRSIDRKATQCSEGNSENASFVKSTQVSSMLANRTLVYSDGSSENSSCIKLLSTQVPPSPIISKMASSELANGTSKYSDGNLGNLSCIKSRSTQVPPSPVISELASSELAKETFPSFKEVFKPIPNIEKCITGWKEIFPWIQYGVHNGSITCRVCQWGYNFPDYYEVYFLFNINHLFCVASKLREHKNKRPHIIALKEHELILKLNLDMYWLLKSELPKIPSFFEKKRNKKLGFPFMEVLSGKRSEEIVVMNLALMIENLLFESLIQSPYFSIVTFGEREYMIVRWLTEDDEVVEHFFSSQVIGSTGNKILPSLAYLQYRGVDMARMVSCSDLVNPLKHIGNPLVKINVANRICPVETCIKWLRQADVLGDIFMHVEVLPKICRLGHSKLDLHYKTKIIAQIRDSEASKIIIDKEAMEFLFKNTALLDKISKEALDFEDSGKLDFEKISKLQSSPMFRALYSLKDFDKIVDKCEFHETVKKLQVLRSVITSEMECLTNLNPHELFVMCVVDMFISHAIISRPSGCSTSLNHVHKMLQGMRSINDHEMEDIFRTFMPELCGGKGFQQLQELCLLCGTKGESSPLKIIASLLKHQEYCHKFPELFKLGQMFMVLPTLNANIERYTFEISVAEGFMRGKTEDHLVPLLMYILLEGPENMKSSNKDKLLKLWCEIYKSECFKGSI